MGAHMMEDSGNCTAECEMRPQTKPPDRRCVFLICPDARACHPDAQPPYRHAPINYDIQASIVLEYYSATPIAMTCHDHDQLKELSRQALPPLPNGVFFAKSKRAYVHKKGKKGLIAQRAAMPNWTNYLPNCLRCTDTESWLVLRFA